METSNGNSYGNLIGKLHNENSNEKLKWKLTVDQLLILFDRWKSSLESFLVRFRVLPFDGRLLFFVRSGQQLGGGQVRGLHKAAVRRGRVAVLVVHELLVLALLIVRTGAGSAQVVAAQVAAQVAALVAALVATQLAA